MLVKYFYQHILNGVYLVFGKYRKPTNIKYKLAHQNSKKDGAIKNKVAPLFFKYTKDIDDHLNYLFPNRKIGLHIDPNNRKYQIDINIIYPEKDNDFYVLYTSGMSSEDMILPEEIETEFPEFKRAELFMMLPKTWDVENMVSLTPSHESSWPMQLLRMIAKYHYEFFTWIGPGYTMEYSYFANNTKLSAAMLVSLNDDISVIKTKDNQFISLYLVLPLYKEEVQYKLQYGYESLIEKYTQNFPIDDSSKWVVDINRKNIVI